MGKKQEKEGGLAQYLFHEGTNFAAYQYLGCHCVKAEGGYRYSFRTWAPHAAEVAVVGDAFGWGEGAAMTRVTEAGLWELCCLLDHKIEGTNYKFRIRHGERRFLKGDPYAFRSEGGAGGASVVCTDSGHSWQDDAWLAHRAATVCVREGNFLAAPLNIYEVHLASFCRHEDGSYCSYGELADRLIPYVKEMGYTHVELMPVTEYPFDGSWGYQVCCYFAPTSRFGTPDDFRDFVDRMHRAGIGVLLDWVPAHFPKDGWGLYEFDGEPLYEYQGWDRMESRSWGTRFFDLGRTEVRSFLISSAMYWLREFHIDGLRVDAVASMIYLDYDREPGQWFPNPAGNNHNMEAVSFLQALNTAVLGEHPDVLMIAEESTAWPGITRPISGEGLGFSLKWNMGWANDFYKYLSTDPLYRRYDHMALNFPIVYAFSENYILPISHDEVVHGKGSFIGKIFGSYEDKFRQMRAALLFMMTFPGKKMLFMGTEFAQFREWDFASSLEWFMMDFPNHRHMAEYVRALNRFYLETPALWEQDFRPEGFSWVYADEADRNLVVYRRHAIGGDSVICAVCFSGLNADNVRIPVQEEGDYIVLFRANGCEATPTVCPAEPDGEDGGSYHITITVPSFDGLVIARRPGSGHPRRASGRRSKSSVAKRRNQSKES